MTARESESLERHFETLTQGTILSLTAIEGDVSLPPAFPALDVVIVSQTCDVVLPKRPTIQVAPLLAVEASIARPENPRYLPVPQGEGRFVDLGWVTTLDKAAAAKADVGEPISDRAEAREFALGLARWYGRYPFTDEIAEWLKPLLSAIREKYQKPDSPLGQVMQKIAELRVTLSDWSGGPTEVILHVIARAGVIPETDDPVQLTDGQLATFLDKQGKFKSAAQVAGMLLKTLDDVGGGAAAAAYWGKFAEALAAECRLGKELENNREFRDAVSGVFAQLSSEDEFTLVQMRGSEILDLEYLSFPDHG